MCKLSALIIYLLNADMLVLLPLYRGSVSPSLSLSHIHMHNLKCLHSGQPDRWISCKCGRICLLGINNLSCMPPVSCFKVRGGQGPLGLGLGPDKEGLCLYRLWVPSPATWDSWTRVCLLYHCTLLKPATLKLNGPAPISCVTSSP